MKEIKKNDWQLGKESKISSTDRIELHQLWLLEQHKEVKDKINEKKPSPTEPEIIGFPD